MGEDDEAGRRIGHRQVTDEIQWPAGICTSAGATATACDGWCSLPGWWSTSREQRSDLAIGGRLKPLIPEANGAERLRLLQADDRVRLESQRLHRCRRAHRHGQDDLARTTRAHVTDCGTGRRPPSQARRPRRSRRGLRRRAAALPRDSAGSGRRSLGGLEPPRPPASSVLTSSPRITLRFSTHAPPSATAPSPSSGLPGAPILRTTSTSSGAPRASATSEATGTPRPGESEHNRALQGERLEPLPELAPGCVAVYEDSCQLGRHRQIPTMRTSITQRRPNDRHVGCGDLRIA